METIGFLTIPGGNEQLAASTPISSALRAYDQERYQRICENAPGMVYQFVLQPCGRLFFPFVSDGCREVCEVEPEVVMQDANVILNMIHPQDRPSFSQSVIDSASQLEPWQWEGRAVCAGNRIKWVQSASRPTLLENGDIVWDGLLLDVTARKLAEQQLAEQKSQLEAANNKLLELNQTLELLASNDGLTGLKNRRVFQEKLNEEIDRVARFHTPLSLILLDVDHFKKYNDSFGHHEGDVVLKTVARLIKDNVRDIDIAARYGGEEFAVILPSTNAEKALIIAERIRCIIEEQDWSLRQITVSVGVATESYAMSDSEMICLADKALYGSKTDGRNRVTHSHTQDTLVLS